MTSIVVETLSSTNSDHQFRLLRSEFEQRLTKIDHYFTELTQSNEFSGSLLISKCGHILLSKGYGSSDYTQQTKNTSKTMYRIGSLSKQFTSFIILKLHEQHLLNIDKDFLSAYLPEYPHSNKIRLKMLLNHTSGITDYTELPQFESECVSKTYKLDELIRLFSHCPLDFEPGTKFHYSNSNYILLGAIIHSISPSKTFEELLNEYILKPLNMNNTIYECNDDRECVVSNNTHQIAKGRSLSFSKHEQML
ncbi:unnamed protein product [Didymodactylos carnosus]|uniref:Beta-lactamase-related domain-containing protein n=1 Tax=Didymodactylos carnosus TaxID=1234261 RepID=A0A814CW45_9BILA|nr:unnamed protein product [Didymodactylos carnosus]CAF1102487.1 unnamed protein product [Didymodactylos carnosus]CAF3725679.1 unnamed protein product [Didymodactylos carnosus]CAF3863709.1 unnamed protein product [Didymodactylos carnosus]